MGSTGNEGIVRLTSKTGRQMDVDVNIIGAMAKLAMIKGEIELTNADLSKMDIQSKSTFDKARQGLQTTVALIASVLSLVGGKLPMIVDVTMKAVTTVYILHMAATKMWASNPLTAAFAILMQILGWGIFIKAQIEAATRKKEIEKAHEQMMSEINEGAYF